MIVPFHSVDILPKSANGHRALDRCAGAGGTIGITDGAACAGAVVGTGGESFADFGEFAGNHARKNVGAAAGWEGHDHAHRLVRIVLGGVLCGGGEAQARACDHGGADKDLAKHEKETPETNGERWPA